ncbi:CobW family GTP-binding protein [Butyrivibrio sp. WCD3002]|uniref:CobW family GTP-binding protein n=1 Tax=Butyrivibrio sp. WCD3002 TaxID=1280676 RepID=UPI00041F2D1F|nr:GTP-binding protein [Butyrivibrio sp. WCD3002]
MTKIDIISGFLGAGKTTLIKKLLKEALAGTKTVLIENEFGEIGIDGGFLKESGIDIREMNSGCICCSLVGDFGTSLKEVMDTYAPERILIEPSGVGKLSDVMRAIQNVADQSTDLTMNSAVTVVDVSKAKVYIKNFGEFFTNQIENAGTILLTRTDKADEAKIETAVELIRQYNPKATIITTPLDQLDGKEVLDTFEGNHDLEAELLKEVLAQKADEHHHHHDHGSEKFTDEDGNTVYRAHKHDHDHDEHHHDHDHDEHEHHHDHDEHDHDHEHDHHHHDADDIFTSWGMETPAKYSKDEIEKMLGRLEEEENFGVVLRAKGMVPDENGEWIEFDYVPGEPTIRKGSADVTGKFCVIGAELKEDNLELLFKRKL